MTTLVFLGTGASGGTPGRKRSRRRESSLLLEGSTSVLIDVTRDVASQLRRVRHLDAVLLTHAHRDASGGIPRLREWWSKLDLAPIRLLAHPATLAAIRARYARLDHCRLIPTTVGQPRRLNTLEVEALEVPHSHDPACPTLAWRVTTDDRSVVYASDVARLEPPLARFSAGASVLVIDGATYRRTVFTHLRIDRDLPVVCRWDVGRILLTQIGRSAPPHEALARIASELCPRALPAYDGLRLGL